MDSERSMMIGIGINDKESLRTEAINTEMFLPNELSSKSCAQNCT